MPAFKSARAVCFTINNPTDAETKSLNTYLEAKCTYAVYGKETGESGTPHYQGYAEFSSSRTFSAWKGALPRAHLERRRGSARQAAVYCKKDGDFVEYGRISSQGARTDLASVVADARDPSLTMFDILERHPVPFLKFNKHISAVRNLQMAQDTKYTPMEVHVFWGDAGSGKTRAAHAIDPDLFMLPCGGGHTTLWFDGYDPYKHKTILMDDFYGGCIKYGYLLKLLDGYRFQLPVKGSFAWKSYTRVIITSNKPPAEWYPDGLSPALKRRITDIVHYHKPISNRS